jgi:hypothetical protein
MVEHVRPARPSLLGCALWSLAFMANAQNPPPEKESAPPSRGLFLAPGPGAVSSAASSRTEKSDKSTDDTVNLLGVLSSDQTEQFNQQLQERQAKLREQLADPKQRAQVVNERIEQQRSSLRDLIALLRLDSRTEDKLLALLADQQLSQELQPRSFGMVAPSIERNDGKPYNPMRDEAARYTQRMNEIRKIIGTTRLDDYVDYQRKLGSRTYVSKFDAVLPAEGKLTLEQRNALTDLFHDQIYRSHLQPRGLGPPCCLK